MREMRNAHKIFCSESLKGIDHLKDLGVDGRITLIWICETDCKDVNWIYVAQDSVHWRTLVNMLKNF
jgi:hypothetical protein